MLSSVAGYPPIRDVVNFSLRSLLFGHNRMWCSTVSGVSHFSHRPVEWQLILNKTWLRVQWSSRSIVSNVPFDLLLPSVYLMWLLTVGWISKYLRHVCILDVVVDRWLDFEIPPSCLYT